MPDYRITAGKGMTRGPAEAVSLVEALIHRAEDIEHRYGLVASNLPYRSLNQPLPAENIAALAADLAAATWKRMSDEVPSYAFAEKLGRRYRESEASVGALLLHWQLFRRAVHLVLADQQIRTGEGDLDQLRQTTLMNYTLDWATEASLVGYVISNAG